MVRMQQLKGTGWIGLKFGTQMVSDGFPICIFQIMGQKSRS